ncbi:hypothetical protein AB0N73_15555 [Microbacterium sp. NPDC089189]|uniref:AAA family ATPase n=1 Tax=Microbacterium sp. NPDC089189 TaxID=3154972 RepID=UPI00343C3697
MRSVVLVLGEAAPAVAEQLRLDGVTVLGAAGPGAFAHASAGAVPDEGLVSLLAAADALVLPARPDVLTAQVVALADRLGVRIVPVGDDAVGRRLAAAFGLSTPVALSDDPRETARGIRHAAPAEPPAVAPTDPRTIAVWGPHGAPGRTTLAIALASELARGGRHVALVDADSHAPAIALALGLPDEGPGFAVACRQAENGALDDVELQRIAVPMGGVDVDVLTGINRPSRWPELSASRVSGALAACASWAQHTVVDVAAPLERDEEIVSDIVDGPRRNAAGIAALESADRVVAVLSADPVGVARFVRGVGELRAVSGTTPVTVVVNRVRRGGVGLDARGQIRRTLSRYADVDDVWFVPEDRRGMDTAMLAARPVAEVAPRSALVAAVRRLVGGALVPPAAPREAIGTRRERRRGRGVGDGRSAA